MYAHRKICQQLFCILEKKMKKIFTRNARLLHGMQMTRHHGKRKKEKSSEAISVGPLLEASGTKVSKAHLLHNEIQTGKGFGKAPPPGPRQEI